MTMLTELERNANEEARHAHRELVEELKAKLANAMEHVADYSNDPHLVEWANATLAELKGEDRR